MTNIFATEFLENIKEKLQWNNENEKEISINHLRKKKVSTDTFAWIMNWNVKDLYTLLSTLILPIKQKKSTKMFDVKCEKYSPLFKRSQTCHFLRKRRGCYHSISRIHVIDRILKLSLIHASLTYLTPWIPWIHWIQWKFC